MGIRSSYKSSGILLAVGMCLVLCLTFPPAGFAGAEEAAANTGDIEGVIYKANGKTPLKDGQLILEEFERGEKTGKEFKSNITDETGEYKLENIPEGFYRGKIMRNNKRYKTKKVDFFFHVVAGETNFVSFSLKKDK